MRGHFVFVIRTTFIDNVCMARGIQPLDGEKILITIRKAPLSLWQQAMKLLVLLALSLLLLYFSSNGYVFILTIALFLLAVIYALSVFTIWFYDVYIITNKRVVISEQRGLFHHENSEIDARDIADVGSIRKGLLATVFGHGTVRIETTAGKIILLMAVEDPDYISQSIHTLASASGRV